MVDHLTVIIEDGEVKYCPGDVANDPIEVDGTKLVNVSDIEDGWTSEAAKSRVVSEARRFVSDFCEDIDLPESFDEMEFRGGYGHIFRPYEPVDTKKRQSAEDGSNSGTSMVKSTSKGWRQASQSRISTPCGRIEVGIISRPVYRGWQL